MTRNRVLPLLCLAAALAGCATPAPAQPAAPGAGVQLSARLASPTSVALSWRGGDQGVAGRVVEFATDPDGQYAVLQFVPARQDTYTHPDLMPETTFYYRVRSYYGPASAPVDVTLPAGDFDENAHQKDPDWAAPKTLLGGRGTTAAIRRPGGAGAPTDLHATVADPNGIRFTWTDHASDEEGYLVEVRPAGSADFSVAAVLDPDVNCYGLVTLPNEKRASYRVRAFYYGPSSNVAHQTTGGNDAG